MILKFQENLKSDDCGNDINPKDKYLWYQGGRSKTNAKKVCMNCALKTVVKAGHTVLKYHCDATVELQKNAREKDARRYFYNMKTSRLHQIHNKEHEYRHVVFRSVQRAKKLLLKELWIDEDTGLEFKITKQKDKYIVKPSRFLYSPFANKKYFIKNLEIELVNIELNPLNKYDNVKIVNHDEYNEILNKKLFGLAEDIINGDKSFYAAKVEKLKKLDIGSKKYTLDENLKPIFAVLRTSEDEFEILKTVKEKQYAIVLNTESDSEFIYSDHSSSKFHSMNKQLIKSCINRAIKLIEEQDN